MRGRPAPTRTASGERGHGPRKLLSWDGLLVNMAGDSRLWLQMGRSRHPSEEERSVATLEVEGAERGWLASVTLDPAGTPIVSAALADNVARDLGPLLQRLLQEPLDGEPVGTRQGDALLHALADVFARRRPLLAGERLFAYVHGSVRPGPVPERPPGWDEP